MYDGYLPGLPWKAGFLKNVCGKEEGEWKRQEIIDVGQHRTYHEGQTVHVNGSYNVTPLKKYYQASMDHDQK